MANDINTVVLHGRLTADIELTEVGDSWVGKFSLAVSHSVKRNGEWSDEVSFFNCELWGKRAHALSQYLLKGTEVFIQGRLKQDRWMNKEGERRNAVKVSVGDIQLGRSAGFSSTDRGQSQPSSTVTSSIDVFSY